MAVQQRRAQRLFQRLDPPGDAGLGEVEPLSGSDDGAGFHHRQKGFEITDIHASHAYSL